MLAKDHMFGYNVRIRNRKKEQKEISAMKQKMIDFLLAHANPSIQLRIKKEILRTITAQEEKAL